MNIFYIPITNKISTKNYLNSIQKRVSFEGVPIKNITGSQFDFGVWGFKNGSSNLRVFDKIKSGDIIFFRTTTKDGYQALDGLGYIASKKNDRDLSYKIWGDGSFENIVLIDKYRKFREPIKLSYKKEITINVTNIPDAVWHRGYDMFRQWDLKGHIGSEQFILELLKCCESDLVYDASLAFEQLGLSNINNHKKINTNDPILKEFESTENIVTIKQRKGQNELRNYLLKKGCKCKICDVNNPNFLTVSHIKMWCYSDNKERIDENNVFLLCPNHDALFDKGYISFDSDGHILISSTLDKDHRKLLNIDENITIMLSEENKKYLKWHRENRFKV